MAAIAPAMAYLLRLGMLPRYNEGMMYFHILFVCGAVIGLLWVRLDRSSWRYASLEEVVAIVKVAACATIVGIVGLIIAGNFDGFPRSILVLSFGALILLMTGPRIAYRLLKQNVHSSARRSMSSRAQPVLLYGYCDNAANFIRYVRSSREMNYNILGIVGHHKKHLRRDLHGVKVIGTLDMLPEIVAQVSSRTSEAPLFVIALPQLKREEKSAIVDQVSKVGLESYILPSVTDFVATDEPIAPQAIKIEDLLERQRVDLDLTGIARLFVGRRVLITGAGGSIGGEICRQLAAFGPAHMSLVENSEFNLYSIEHDLRREFPALSLAAILCDVRDRDLVNKIIQREKPEVIFHAAAVKHVPLAEANILEAIKTNVLGTRNVADAALANNCVAMVMISTDKAVNPTNIMGATKRFAEAYCQRLDCNSTKTRFMTVRFGNVLNSAGSVVPLFAKQIAAGGPVTVTHPDIQRYFMTISEAVRLVIAASASGLSRGMDRGLIHVLEMGKPVKIVDLARRMIQLNGKQPDIDIKIDFIGLRPGEKLFEEIFESNETVLPTDSPWLHIALYRNVNDGAMEEAVALIETSITHYNEATAVEAITMIVPELKRNVLSGSHTVDSAAIPSDQAPAIQ